MKKSELRKIIKESIKGLVNEQQSNPGPGCTTADLTMAGSCAQTHLPPNMNWSNSVNYNCQGYGSPKFMSLIYTMMPQISSIVPYYWNPNTNVTPPEVLQLRQATKLFKPYSQISSAVNTYALQAAGGITSPYTGPGSIGTFYLSSQQKGQLKRKLAKYHWAHCMMQVNACNCPYG